MTWYQENRVGDFMDYVCENEKTIIRAKYVNKEMKVLLKDGVNFDLPENIMELHELSTGEKWKNMDAIKMQGYQPLD